jgi:rfaE bifunctional protein nucleotidyltransferase chain/domain
MPRLPADKIVALPELMRKYPIGRRERIVFTNGCFDILHRGHVEYLAAARMLGDALVVGLNTDESVRRLKGAGRPVNEGDDRAVVLAALESVDHVVFFGEDTPLELISSLLPNVLVKGGDYSIETIVGAREVIAAGGEVVIAPLLPGRSTTAILSRSQGGAADG